MCDKPGCELETTFPDGKSLDTAVPEAMLRPYPELWKQWQVKVYGPWEDGLGPGPGGDPMYHSPTYLKAVIHEYEWLREGGDRPDPALSARCEAIVTARPKYAEERRRYLSDPWQRAQTSEMLRYRVASVADYYDPEYLQNKIGYLN